jgi:fused signal recognition particle receptor
MFDKLKKGLKNLVTKVTTTELQPENIHAILADFKMSLVENDVAFPVADHVCDELEKRLTGVQVKRLEDRKKVVEENLRKVLLEVLLAKRKIDLLECAAEKRAKKEPLLLLFVGINGTGKTTTIAKVAQFFKDKNYSVVLAASDTYRAGSIEQLDEHAKRLGLRVIKGVYGGDAASVAYDAICYAKAHGTNVVLIDTAGRMQTNQNLMNELQKVKRVVCPDLTVFTVDSLILTKVDADVKGGSALSVTYVTQKPILFIGVGQTYKDLELFNPEKFVQMILR